MSIRISAYDTAATAGLKTNDISEALQRAYITSEITKNKHMSIREDLMFEYSIVDGTSQSQDSIKFFFHPMLFNTGKKDSNGQNVKQLAIDVRNFGKLSPHDGYVIRNHSEYYFHLNRLILNQLWMTTPSDTLKNVSNIPMLTMANLISECIAKRFALNPLEQMSILVYTCYYYNSCFTDDKLFDETQYHAFVGNIIRSTRLPSEKVYELLDGLEKKPINSIEELILVIKRNINNQSLDNLNLGILYSVVCSTWFGTNAKETLAVGLEHIPTWIMIVYSSINDATFKRSILSKISTKFTKQSDNFNSNMANILNTSLK